MTPEEIATNFVKRINPAALPRDEMIAELTGTIRAAQAAAVAEAVRAEREACEWHIQQAINFYEERIAWCNTHPGNEIAKATSLYALESHRGVIAAIRARNEVTK